MDGRDRSFGDRGGFYKGYDKGYYGNRFGGWGGIRRVDDKEIIGRRIGK